MDGTNKRTLLVSTAGVVASLAGCSGQDPADAAAGSAGQQTPRWQELLNVTRTAQEDEWLTWGWEAEQTTELEVTLTVRSGPAIDFYVMDESEWDQYQAGNRARYHDLSMPNTTGGSRRGTLSGGSYVFVIDNTEHGEAAPPTNFDEDPARLELIVRGR